VGAKKYGWMQARLFTVIRSTTASSSRLSIGRDALLVAELGAVPLAGKAGVVAVGAAVAVRGGADNL
jgi:hypothetical protein